MERPEARGRSWSAEGRSLKGAAKGGEVFKLFFTSWSEKKFSTVRGGSSKTRLIHRVVFSLAVEEIIIFIFRFWTSGRFCYFSTRLSGDENAFRFLETR